MKFKVKAEFGILYFLVAVPFTGQQRWILRASIEIWIGVCYSVNLAGMRHESFPATGSASTVLEIDKM